MPHHEEVEEATSRHALAVCIDTQITANGRRAHAEKPLDRWKDSDKNETEKLLAA
jgi:hypothetical protein